MWYTIYSNKRARYDPARDDKFKAFARMDYERWSYFNALFTHFFFLPRFCIGWLTFLCVAILGILLCIGEDPFKLPLWKKRIIVQSCVFTSYVIAFCGGIIPRRVRTKVDYSKYLGKDYKTTWDGAGIHVLNHLSAIDAAI
jgi:hypothetical protein